MTDKEIAESTHLQPIIKIARKLGLKNNQIELYGEDKAKIKNLALSPKGKLILVTAINPTKAGEGKTTVSIGLADGLSLIKKKVCLALREPSLGPVFGMKGGATGGGYSQIAPMADINLHFTGDMHAITSANNLLAAIIDNHIFQGNELKIKTVTFNRCMDMNDRALRDITLYGKEPRQDKFNITAASELMAILSLSENLDDLINRIGNITIGINENDEPVYCRDLSAQNAMAILLKDAIKPNLVQTLIGTPAIVHCGPFANIAHGCNSIIATRTSMTLADYTVTEAGFGADLGAEKFLDVKCRIGKLRPDAVVLVATVRALKLHGGANEKELKEANIPALTSGVANLKRHINNLKNVFKIPLVVAINIFADDTEEELQVIENCASECGASCVRANVWGQGGKGAIELAQTVVKKCQEQNNFTFAYSDDEDILSKSEDIVKKIYGGDGVVLEDKAVKDLEIINKLGLSHYPVVIAKTQYSFSDVAELLGAPKDFKVTIREFQIRTGAGFIVAIAGKMLLMPALNKTPAAFRMKIDGTGKFNL